MYDDAMTVAVRADGDADAASLGRCEVVAVGCALSECVAARTPSATSSRRATAAAAASSRGARETGGTAGTSVPGPAAGSAGSATTAVAGAATGTVGSSSVGRTRVSLGPLAEI